MKQFIEKYKHGWVFIYFFIYLTWFFYLEQRTGVQYASVYTKLDDYIPFNEWFVIPYFIWFLYIGVVIGFLFLKSKGDFYRCTGFLCTGMTICLIIYTIWPNGQNLRPAVFPRDNFLVNIVKELYLTDTSTNVCPSIHVFNSIGAHIAICHSSLFKNKKWVKGISFGLMVSISLSTVFLKQHSVIDGLCAILLAFVLYFVVYKLDYSKLFNRKKERVAEQ